MILLAAIGLLLLGLAMGLVVWALVLPRSRAALRIQEIEAYGVAGPAPGPVGDAAPRESIVTRLANRIGLFLSQRVSGGVSPEDIRKHLIAAGMYKTSPLTIMGYRVFAAVLLLVISPGFNLLPGPVGQVVIAAVMAYAGWRLPVIFLERRAKARQLEIDRSLPDLIDQVVIMLEAGVGFGNGLQIAGDQMKGPLGVELRLTLQEQRMGLALRNALLNLVGRADTPNMRTFVRAVTQAETLGVSIGTVMRNVAIEMRKRRRQQAEERAQKAPIKMLFPLVFLIFPAMFVILLGPAVVNISNTLSH
ncbi:MAG: tight adherence protein [Solirubrobacteraceae bacterium]|nr:tight adherence protein [Solirubrobacteraceae bacterium]